MKGRKDERTNGIYEKKSPLRSETGNYSQNAIRKRVLLEGNLNGSVLKFLLSNSIFIMLRVIEGVKLQSF